jgi:hypothetical protein
VLDRVFTGATAPAAAVPTGAPVVRIKCCATANAMGAFLVVTSKVPHMGIRHLLFQSFFAFHFLLSGDEKGLTLVQRGSKTKCEF